MTAPVDLGVMPFYEVHYQRRADSLNDFVRIRHGTHVLARAAAQRELSGDLVVEVRHGKAVRVCSDPAWLWEWEKADPSSYAARAIRGGR